MGRGCCGWKHLLAITAMTVALALPGASEAADNAWTGGDGYWSTGGNWSLNTVPAAGDAAILNSSGAVAYDATATDPSLSSLGIYSSDGNRMVLDHSTGTLTLPGDASLTINGTGFDYSGNPSYAAYNLSGTGVLIKEAFEVKIGTDGAGEFNQSDGSSFQFSGAMYLGDQAGSKGTYNMTGGVLTGWTGTRTVDIEGVPTDVYKTWYGGLVLGEWGGRGEFLHSGGDATISNLTLARQENSQGEYTLSGASSLTVMDNVTIGQKGTGVFTQNGGAHKIGGELVVGDASGSAGTYNLNGGALEVTRDIFLGRSAGSSGTFNQSGGTSTVQGNLYIDMFASSSKGVYNLSGGQLDVKGSTIVGSFGTAEFNQGPDTTSITDANDGGTHTVANNLVLGQSAGSNGTYSLSGGQLDVKGSTIVGDSGTATFNQSGGTHSITDDINIGYNNGSYGEFNLSGGTLDAGWQYVGGDGGGNGVFNHSSGTNTARNQLVIGAGSGSTGTYNLSGGTLEVSRGDTITGHRGDATFNHTGGTFTVNNGSLILGNEAGSAGRYNLSGTGVLSTANTFIGNYGNGEFNQSGGVNYVGYDVSGNSLGVFSELIVGRLAGSTGTYNLSGDGKLYAAREIVGDAGGYGSFTQSGSSVHEVAENLIIGQDIWTGSLGDGAPWGSFSLKDNAQLTVKGSVFLGDEGGNGYFEQSGTSQNTILGALVIGGNSESGTPAQPSVGKYIQMGGTLTTGMLYLGLESGSRGTYELHSGNLNTTDETQIGDYVGRTGDGVFKQTGGAYTSANGIIIAYDSSSRGTYELHGGTLNARSLTIGARETSEGVFRQTGGKVVLTNNLTLGSQDATASGRYEIGNEAVLTTPYLLIGYGGKGTFVQTNGEVAVSNNLRLGYEANGEGRYELSGGRLTVDGLSTIGKDGKGAFIQSGGAYTAKGDLTINSSSEYELSGGSLSAQKIINNGLLNYKDSAALAFTSISGSGTFVGNLRNNTVVAPGNSPGTMNITGNYTQGNSGILQIELATASHDILNITGTASLDGNLQLFLWGGYLPTSGSTFDFLRASDGIAGIFKSINGPAGYTWDVAYLDLVDNDGKLDTARLTATTNPVPVPAAVWLLGTGLIGLIGLRRKTKTR
jgi:hypothetical protein